MTQRRMIRCLLQLHRDDRGNMGVLLLLTIWSIVALLGLLWNSAEADTRRTNMQTAADSAAQAAETWVARTNNVITATNMVMCQNGSAEALLNSLTPTENSVGSRLVQEKQKARRLLLGDQPGTAEAAIPDTEYFEELLGFGAWANSGRGVGLLVDRATLEQQITAELPVILPALPPPEAKALQAQVASALRRNAVGLTWLQNTWVLGQGPTAGLPAAPDGVGLQSRVSGWVENQVKSRLQAILNGIPPQVSQLDEFTLRSSPALNMSSPWLLRQRRSDMFDYERRTAGMTADTIEEQRARLASFYRCDITLARPGTETTSGPARITAPLQDAGDIDSQPHADSIRPRYPVAAIERFGTADPNIKIDPINVNADDSTIWHPGVDIAVPAADFTALGRTFQATFHVNGSEFGQVYCAPLARYFNDRVARDLQGLLPYMVALDDVRTSVRDQVYPMPAHGSIPNIPLTIPDPAGGAPISIPPDALPLLPVPGTLSGPAQMKITMLNNQIRVFNQRVANYSNELRFLPTVMDQMYVTMRDFVDVATQRFAEWTWRSTVDNNRQQVLREIGSFKEFMVLQTYDLHPVPEWAKPGMWNSAQQYVARTIYANDIVGLTQNVQNAVEQWLITVYSNAYFANYYQQGMQAGLPPNQAAQQATWRIRQQAHDDAVKAAPGIAENVARRGADQISREVAVEWVARLWPYEVTPPQVQTPPVRGMPDADRITDFTVVAAARTNAASNPSLLTTMLAPRHGRPMMAYAQAETFNWMEFNNSYGAAERFDQVTDEGFGVVGGSPSCWRIGTTGGWNWQPRLAFADALTPALDSSSQLTTYFAQSGVLRSDPVALNMLNNH
jgi:hypothetical protein